MKHFLVIMICIGGLHAQVYAGQLQEEERVAGWVLVGDDHDELDFEVIGQSRPQSRVQSPIPIQKRSSSPQVQENNETMLFINPVYDPEFVNAQNVEFKAVEQNQAGDSNSNVSKSSYSTPQNYERSLVLYQQQRETQMSQPKELETLVMVRDLEKPKEELTKNDEENVIECVQFPILDLIQEGFEYIGTTDLEEAAMDLMSFMMKRTQDIFYPEA